MEDESRRSWVLIAVAAVGLVLGALALFIAFDAKSASDDAADRASVTEVSDELSKLIDRLGIAEESLSGKETTLRGESERAARQARKERAGLSGRIDTLESQVRSLQARTKQIPTLRKQVGSLESQLEATDSRVATLSERVTKLSRRFNDSGGQNAG